MSGVVVARVSVAPVVRAPSPRAEQVTQLVLGETARILERDGVWRRIQAEADGYEGWVNTGYVLELDPGASARWSAKAEGWSDGAVLRANGSIVRLPVRSRVTLSGRTIGLPDGRRGSLIAGSVRRLADVVRSARLEPPHHWARKVFAGTPYQWGGVTPWGVDCSGLVQTSFRARGIDLPRDASQQIACGTPIPLDRREPGDLLFFVEQPDGAVAHVALAGEQDSLVHATLSCGGFVEEPWGPGTRAGFLQERLVAVRRTGS